ncbi:hypothetical protein D3C83_172740 [compost metagenome]
MITTTINSESSREKPALQAPGALLAGLIAFSTARMGRSSSLPVVPTLAAHANLSGSIGSD